MSCGCGRTTKPGGCRCGSGYSGYSGGSSGSRANCGCSGGGACGCSCGGSTGLSGGTFVRPRFFAGQLLTEDELGSIVEYAAAKSRLHNRYFMGDGVVCGLTASCSSVRGSVRVAAGYALDCCGNDVVVPCDVEVPVLAMIAALPRVNSCDQPCDDAPKAVPAAAAAEPATPAAAAKDIEVPRFPPRSTAGVASALCRTYTLVLVYDEEPAELVAAYPIDQDPCGQSATCEASLVREGYRFELRCGHPDRAVHTILTELECCLADLCPDDQNAKGFAQRAYGAAEHVSPVLRAMIAQRVGADRAKFLGGHILARGLKGLLGHCFDRLGTVATTVVVAPSETDRQWLADLRQRMIDRLESRPLTSCTLLCDVVAVRLDGDLTKAAEALEFLLLRLLLECICEAVNPPCDPCDDPAIVLATVCVDECDVVDICNAVRRHVLTGPALRYWLPPIGMVESFVEELCCDRSKFLPAHAVAVEEEQQLVATIEEQKASIARSQGQLQALRVLRKDAVLRTDAATVRGAKARPVNGATIKVAKARPVKAGSVKAGSVKAAKAESVKPAPRVTSAVADPEPDHG